MAVRKQYVRMRDHIIIPLKITALVVLLAQDHGVVAFLNEFYVPRLFLFRESRFLPIERDTAVDFDMRILRAQRNECFSERSATSASAVIKSNPSAKPL